MKLKIIAGIASLALIVAIGIRWNDAKANDCADDVVFMAGARPDPMTGMLILSNLRSTAESCTKTTDSEESNKNVGETNTFMAGVTPNNEQLPNSDKSIGIENGTVIAYDTNMSYEKEAKASNELVNEKNIDENFPETFYKSESAAPEFASQNQAPKPVVTPTEVKNTVPMQNKTAQNQRNVQVIKPAPAKSNQVMVERPSTALSNALNLDKLSMAVAMHETHNCQDKTGSALLNNCHGFKKKGQFMKFNSPSESHAYFKQLWAKSYKRFPDLYLAKIYSGNDRAETWLKNVTYYYYNL